MVSGDWGSTDIPRGEDFFYWKMEWLGQDNILRKTNKGETQQSGQALEKMTPGTINMQ